MLRDYHHFKVDHLVDGSDRVAIVERRVVNILIDSKLTESDRESSVAFELKHSSATTQFARLLARKRGLDLDLSAIGAVLHDIYVITHGKYKNHAKLGGELAEDILLDTGMFSSEERLIVNEIVVNHSDKHIKSDNPYIEFGKDADVLDCFFYPDAIEYYLKYKPIPIMKEYLARAKAIWRDLGIPIDDSLNILDHYTSGWLDSSSSTEPYSLISTVSKILNNTSSRHIKGEGSFLPVLFVDQEFNNSKVYFNASAAERYFADSMNTKQCKKLLESVLTGNLESYKGDIPSDQKISEGAIVWSPIGLLQPLEGELYLARKNELIAIDN